jgi:hypothetical protein
VGSRPKSMRVLWTLLGYEPFRGVRYREEKQRRWKRVLDADPELAHWLKSEKGLRAPAYWPPRIAEEFHRGGAPVSPLVFALACFPGRVEIAASYTGWRGMPELCAAAHGWRLTEEQVGEACYAARALCGHVPFVVYALCPDFTGVPLPSSGAGMMRRLIERQEFVLDPLGRAPFERRHAIDENVWHAEVIKALPRTRWTPCSRAVPVERSLVEGGYAGWVPTAERPCAA